MLLGSLFLVDSTAEFMQISLQVIVPMVVRTLWLALRRELARHRDFARWTLPLWLYVSVSGVIVYWMLYHLS